MLRISQYDWMPNYNLDKVLSLIAVGEEERCPILYSRGAYASNSEHSSSEKTKTYKYPLIHAMTKKGVKLMTKREMKANTSGSVR